MARLFTDHEMTPLARAIADSPYAGSKRRDKIIALLRHFQALGYTLEACCDPRRLNLSERTLEKYCRRGRIAFPDYVPMVMREKAKGHG